MGQTQRGVDLISEAITINADFAQAHSNLGLGFQNLKRPEEALASYDRAIALKSDSAETYSNRGTVLQDLNRPEEALASYDRAIALKPDYAKAYYNRGLVLQYLKRSDEALENYNKAIALKPDYTEAHIAREIARKDLKRPEEALASYDSVIAEKPDHAEAYSNRGKVQLNLNRPEEALASFDRAIALKPDYAEAYSNRGNALQDLKRHEEALASYDRAIALRPDLAEVYSNRGNALHHMKRLKEALASYDRAIALKPDLAQVYFNRGNVLLNMNRPEEALANYDKAIALKPDLTQAWSSRGTALNILKRHDQAAISYAKVLKLEPQHPFTKGDLLHQKMLSCDWNGIGNLIVEIESDVASGKMSAVPFGWQGVAKSPRSLQLCAEIYNEKRFPANLKHSIQPSFGKNNKIRVGYSSGEFRDQAVAMLLVGVWEHHDNSQFEIFAFDNGWDDLSDTRRRINGSIHHVINIRDLSDSQAAAVISDNKIDILINLNGYFGEERNSVFAMRPAPIQVNYLGFPGTLGASYMDYIIADQQVIPATHKAFYKEKVVYLPDCYLATDRKKGIGTHIFSRAECGLPERGFVFCCFNNNYKILPDIFDIWMRVLKQIKGSVLWLLEDNATASANLRKEAMARGVNAERLIFAKRMPLPEHLARHQCADLFIDTLPYNAHTTASDALWTGLPVLTCQGETFVGRVATSMLSAMHLPELITTTLEDYERVTIELAMNPEKLARIKQKLDDNRLTTPLFDTMLFTKHIEKAYTAMYERHLAGLVPDHLIIPNS